MWRCRYRTRFSAARRTDAALKRCLFEIDLFEGRRQIPQRNFFCCTAHKRLQLISRRGYQPPARTTAQARKNCRGTCLWRQPPTLSDVGSRVALRPSKPDPPQRFAYRRSAREQSTQPLPRGRRIHRHLVWDIAARRRIGAFSRFRCCLNRGTT